MSLFFRRSRICLKKTRWSDGGDRADNTKVQAVVDLLRKRAIGKNALRPTEKYENTLDSALMVFGYKAISVLWLIIGWS